MAQVIPTKSWWQSKTVWSAVAAALVAGLSSYYGDTSVFVAGVVAVLSAFGVYGRVTATNLIR